MKNKIYIALVALAVAPILGFSQIDLIPTVGYNFGAKMPIYGGELKIKGATTYGVKLDFHPDPSMAIQFMYTNTQSSITITDYYYPGGGIQNHNFSDVSENYFLLGGLRYLNEGQIQAYGNFNLGMAYYNINNVDEYYDKYVQSDAYRFAIGFGLGAKAMISERIGLDFHIRALAPIQWGGLGIGVGTGGASAGAYVGSSFISGDVGGGLVIRLGE
jgi:hypothetical protein